MASMSAFARLAIDEALCGGGVYRMAEFGHGFGFNLAYAFACEVKMFANFFEGSRFAAVEAVSKCDDESFSVVEHAQQHRNFEWEQGDHRGVEGRNYGGVRHKVSQLGVNIGADRLVERQRRDRETRTLANIELRDTQSGRDFSAGRRPLERRFQV